MQYCFMCKTVVVRLSTTKTTKILPPKIPAIRYATGMYNLVATSLLFCKHQKSFLKPFKCCTLFLKGPRRALLDPPGPPPGLQGPGFPPHDGMGPPPPRGGPGGYGGPPSSDDMGYGRGPPHGRGLPPHGSESGPPPVGPPGGSRYGGPPQRGGYGSGAGESDERVRGREGGRGGDGGEGEKKGEREGGRC